MPELCHDASSTTRAGIEIEDGKWIYSRTICVLYVVWDFIFIGSKTIVLGIVLKSDELLLDETNIPGDVGTDETYFKMLANDVIYPSSISASRF